MCYSKVLSLQSVQKDTMMFSPLAVIYTKLELSIIHCVVIMARGGCICVKGWKGSGATSSFLVFSSVLMSLHDNGATG